MDTFDNVAGHALCGAHYPAGARRGHRDRHGPGPGVGAAGHRRAARPGPGRHGKLQEKRHALTARMQAREDDYLRFARGLRVPFTK
jgi:hypothetical protein